MRIEKRWFLTFAMMLLTPLAVARAADSPDPLMADLSITNTTMPNPATVQENLTYGMNVINNGSSVATSVQVIDTLPPGVTLVSASFNFIGGASTPCTGTTTITCNIGTMGVGRLQGAAVLITIHPISIITDKADKPFTLSFTICPSALVGELARFRVGSENGDEVAWKALQALASSMGKEHPLRIEFEDMEGREYFQEMWVEDDRFHNGRVMRRDKAPD